MVGGEEIAYYTSHLKSDDVKFRPLRTERDHALEQMVEVFSSNSATGITAIYDAIVAGKIDGLGKVD